MRALLFSLCFVGFAGDEPTPKDVPQEHQGTWAVRSFLRNGEETPEEIVKTIRRKVEGSHVVWSREEKAFAGTSIEIDDTTDPKSLVLIPDGGPARDKRVLGIYKFEGKILTICMADPDEPRPTEFKAPAGSKHTLLTFEKIEEEPRPRKKNPD